MLKRVKIQGYKSLADVEVQLQPLSVLFGPNASGKSNFLDALQLLSRIANSRTLNDAFDPPYRGTPLESFTFGPNGITDLLTRERISFSIEVYVELSETVIDAVHRQIHDQDMDGRIPGEANGDTPASTRPLIQEKHLNYTIEIEFFPKSGMLHIAKEALSVVNAAGQPIQGVVSPNPSDSSILFRPAYRYHRNLPYLIAMREELARWFFYYLEPRERMRIPTPIKEVRHPGLMGEDLAAFLNTLHALDERQFDAVEKALHMAVPSIPGLEVGVNSRGDVELRFLEGQTAIPIRVISEGTLRVLGLLASGVAKDKPSVLGFEEPENGIHPRRIRLVALFLETRARSDTQVIVTTHSPTLIDFMPTESLYVCRKVDGRTAIEPFSLWEYSDLDEALDQEYADLPELTVSERLLRGDFDA